MLETMAWTSIIPLWWHSSSAVLYWCWIRIGLYSSLWCHARRKLCTLRYSRRCRSWCRSFLPHPPWPILRRRLSVSAFRRVFEDVTVTGNWFHFAQSIIKRVHKLGLKDEYVSEPDVQDIVRCLLGLPLLRAEEICPAFDEVKLAVGNDSRFVNKLNGLLRYAGRQCMDPEALNWSCRQPEQNEKHIGKLPCCTPLSNPNITSEPLRIPGTLATRYNGVYACTTWLGWQTVSTSDARRRRWIWWTRRASKHAFHGSTRNITQECSSYFLRAVTVSHSVGAHTDALMFRSNQRRKWRGQRPRHHLLQRLQRLPLRRRHRHLVLSWRVIGIIIIIINIHWQTSSWSITPMAGGGALRHVTYATGASLALACQADFWRQLGSPAQQQQQGAGSNHQPFWLLMKSQAPAARSYLLTYLLTYLLRWYPDGDACALTTLNTVALIMDVAALPWQ